MGAAECAPASTPVLSAALGDSNRLFIIKSIKLYDSKLQPQHSLRNKKQPTQKKIKLALKTIAEAAKQASTVKEDRSKVISPNLPTPKPSQDTDDLSSIISYLKKEPPKPPLSKNPTADIFSQFNQLKEKEKILFNRQRDDGLSKTPNLTREEKRRLDGVNLEEERYHKNLMQNIQDTLVQNSKNRIDMFHQALIMHQFEAMAKANPGKTIALEAERQNLILKFIHSIPPSNFHNNDVIDQHSQKPQPQPKLNPNPNTNPSSLQIPISIPMPVSPSAQSQTQIPAVATKTPMSKPLPYYQTESTPLECSSHYKKLSQNAQRSFVTFQQTNNLHTTRNRQVIRMGPPDTHLSKPNFQHQQAEVFNTAHTHQPDLQNNLDTRSYLGNSVMSPQGLNNQPNVFSNSSSSFYSSRLPGHNASHNYPNNRSSPGPSQNYHRSTYTHTHTNANTQLHANTNTYLYTNTSTNTYTNYGAYVNPDTSASGDAYMYQNSRFSRPNAGNVPQLTRFDNRNAIGANPSSYNSGMGASMNYNQTTSVGPPTGNMSACDVEDGELLEDDVNDSQIQARASSISTPNSNNKFTSNTSNRNSNECVDMDLSD